MKYVLVICGFTIQRSERSNLLADSRPEMISFWNHFVWWVLFMHVVEVFTLETKIKHHLNKGKSDHIDVHLQDGHT